MSSRARVGGTNPGAFKPKSSPINRGGANLARGQPIAAQVEPPRCLGIVDAPRGAGQRGGHSGTSNKHFQAIGTGFSRVFG